MLCKYALNGGGKLVFVDDVENGIKCNCTCPCCGEKMVAKNNGKIKDHHFAHSSGSDCDGYKERLFHIWSKQIIEEKKEFTIPKYKKVLGSKKLKFSSVKIEQRNDTKLLQPDIVGVTDDGVRIWIEIFVTHKCGEEKIQCIKENGYNCIEVKIPEEIETKEDLSEFLVNSDDSDFKYFINYPYGDALVKELVKEKEKRKKKENKKSEKEKISDKFPFRNQKEVDYFIKYGDYKKIDETQDSYAYFGKPRSQWSNDELKMYQKNVLKWTEKEISEYQKNVFGIIEDEIEDETDNEETNTAKTNKIDIDSLIGKNLNFEFD